MWAYSNHWLPYCQSWIILVLVSGNFWSTIMVREKDSVWEEWRSVPNDGDINKYAKCKHCEHRLQVNVTRFKQYTVLCNERPDTVEAKYRDTVLTQSVITISQKTTLTGNSSKSAFQHYPLTVSAEMSVEQERLLRRRIRNQKKVSKPHSLRQFTVLKTQTM